VGVYDEVVQATNEFKRYRRRLTGRLDRERRAPSQAEYRKLGSLWEAWDRAYAAYEEEGSPPAPPGLVQVLLPPPAWGELEDEFGPVEAALPEATRHPGGPPLKPVMPVEHARQLQAVIDVALKDGNELVIDRLARRFDVSRGRIRQAVEKRRRGDDLSVSPPELRTVTDSTGFVYWAPPENPSKS
jgi:hypothetical protein